MNASKLKPPDVIPFQPFDVTLEALNGSHVVCVRGSLCLAELDVDLGETFSIVFSPVDERIVDRVTYRVAEAGPARFVFSSVPFNFTLFRDGVRIRADADGATNWSVATLFVDPDARLEMILRKCGVLEAFARRVLNEVAHNVSVRIFSSHEERLRLIALAEAERAWIRAPVSHPGVAARLSALKRAMSPIYRRMQDNATFWEHIEVLGAAIQWANSTLEHYPFSDSPGKIQLRKHMDSAREFLESAIEAFASHKPHLGLPISVDEVARARAEFDEECQTVSTKIRRLNELLGEEGKPAAQQDWAEIMGLGL